MKTFLRGEKILVQPGEEFQLCLDALGAAGYEWQVTKTDPGIRVRGLSVCRPAEGVGGENLQGLRFQAVRAGTFSVHLEYKRPWETRAEDTLDVTVRAREAR